MAEAAVAADPDLVAVVAVVEVKEEGGWGWEAGLAEAAAVGSSFAYCNPGTQSGSADRAFPQSYRCG